MSIENKNIINLDLKNEEKILDFSDFQKQNIKFDIDKLQEIGFSKYKASLTGLFKGTPCSIGTLFLNLSLQYFCYLCSC